MKHILLLTALFFIVGCNNEEAVNPIVLNLMLTELESRIEQLESTNKVISASIIKLYNADGKMVAYLGNSEGGGGILQTFNADGKKVAHLGGGFLESFNADGKKNVYLGTNKQGNGMVKTFDNLGVVTGYFGTSNNDDGMIELYDAYGDLGWSVSGRK